MEQNTKTFIKWFLIYGIAFGTLTALFDFLQNKTNFILKNVIGGLIFGLVMSYLKVRAQRRNEENKN
jgi:NhaP-type Na+/H+ or K+/H+ antiporter